MPGQKGTLGALLMGGNPVSWHNPATTERGWSGRLGVRLAPSGLGSLTEHVRKAWHRRWGAGEAPRG